MANPKSPSPPPTDPSTAEAEAAAATPPPPAPDAGAPDEATPAQPSSDQETGAAGAMGPPPSFDRAAIVKELEAQGFSAETVRELADYAEKQAAAGNLDGPGVVPTVVGSYAGIGVEAIHRSDGTFAVNPETGFVTGRIDPETATEQYPYGSPAS